MANQLALNFRAEQTLYQTLSIRKSFASYILIIFIEGVKRFVCYRVLMSAIKRRENTFRIDYANVPKKPSSEEVHRFIGVTLGMKREDVRRIQYSRNLGIAYIKTASFETAQKIVEENDKKHEIVVDGKTYIIRLMMEDGAVEVKIFNLSEDVSNQKITRFLSAYGEIFSIRDEVWDEKHYFPGLPTGVRIVRMTIKKNISSYVTIDGETTLLSYYGQQQTCRHCSEFIHNGVSCVQNKKLLVQKLAANSISYADVIKAPKSSHTKSLKHSVTKLGEKSHFQTQKTTSTEVEQSTSGSMPCPPASIQCDEQENSAVPTKVQQEENVNEAWVEVPRKLALPKKASGNDTDSSTSSKRTTRNTKKKGCEESDDPQDTDPHH